MRLGQRHRERGRSVGVVALQPRHQLRQSLKVGRTAIEAAYAQRPRERITRHLVTNTRVVVESGSAAMGRSLVLLWAGSTEDAEGPQGRPLRGPQLIGEFADRFVHTDEGWRFASRDASFVLHAGG